MALTPGTRLGVYEITAQIGVGGMGEVYRARDTRLHREVALKVIRSAGAHDAERLARLRREAEILASLDHPCIAQIHGLEEVDGTTALVLELVEGPTLAERLREGPIGLDEARRIAEQIAEALEAAHAHGIIHRDLKPSNIKVRPDGKVKVLDFGLAKALDPAAAAQATAGRSDSSTITLPEPLTGLGILLGTPAYMSPEQAKGSPASKRSDVWAFGCVLYEMLAACRAFPGEDMFEVLAGVVHRDPDWSKIPAETPLVIRDLLQACLAKDAGERISDIAAALFGTEAAGTADDRISVPVDG